MHFRLIRNVLLALMFVLTGKQAFAATLIHEFAFEGNANDGVGLANATLLNDASITGGVLSLHGANDYLEFDRKLVPTGGVAFSVAVQARSTAANTNGIVEIISQGFSGTHGFYLGYNFGTIRLTDQFVNTQVSFPADRRFHDYVITSEAGVGTRLYIDGNMVFSNSNHLQPTTTGTNTRLGRQFDPYGEYFTGQIDNLKIYSGALTGNEVANAFAAVPLPAGLSLLSAAVAGLGFLGWRRKQPAAS